MLSRAERFAAFRKALKDKSLKSTSQRDDIAHVFFGGHRHMSIDELYREVRKVNPRVGYATVYRTIKLLKECGLADEQHFADGQTRYENADVGEQHHHDHVICDRCGRIVEFSDDDLERLQEDIATRLGFVLARHRLELYGICRDCREGVRPSASTDRVATTSRR
jgi:Fur family transcriptional regulator, ferric uptake regulator